MTAMSTLAVSRITVAVDGSNAGGLLVLNDGVLVAVLVCLDEAFYGIDRGRWHLEAGFGKCAASPPAFDRLGDALRWVAKRLGLDPESVMPAIAGLKEER
jgi:hypothetical protein